MAERYPSQGGPPSSTGTSDLEDAPDPLPPELMQQWIELIDESMTGATTEQDSSHSMATVHQAVSAQSTDPSAAIFGSPAGYVDIPAGLLHSQQILQAPEGVQQEKSADVSWLDLGSQQNLLVPNPESGPTELWNAQGLWVHTEQVQFQQENAYGIPATDTSRVAQPEPIISSSSTASGSLQISRLPSARRGRGRPRRRTLPPPTSTVTRPEPDSALESFLTTSSIQHRRDSLQTVDQTVMIPGVSFRLNIPSTTHASISGGGPTTAGLSTVDSTALALSDVCSDDIIPVTLPADLVSLEISQSDTIATASQETIHTGISPEYLYQSQQTQDHIQQSITDSVFESKQAKPTRSQPHTHPATSYHQIRGMQHTIIKYAMEDPGRPEERISGASTSSSFAQSSRSTPFHSSQPTSRTRHESGTHIPHQISLDSSSQTSVRSPHQSSPLFPGPQRRSSSPKFVFPPRSEQLSDLSHSLSSYSPGAASSSSVQFSPASFSSTSPSSRASEFTSEPGEGNVREKLQATIKSRRGSISTSKQTEGTGKSQKLTPEMLAKKERRKEQNRRAAQKCRQKKREASDSVIKDYKRLQTSNTSLNQEIKQLHSQRKTLIETLESHKKSCDWSAEWQQSIPPQLPSGASETVEQEVEPDQEEESINIQDTDLESDTTDEE